MIYDFSCKECGQVVEDVHLHINHTDDEHPMCCDNFMRHHHTKAPYVAWEDQQLLDGGFKAAHDGTLITTREQNKEYMHRHGLENAMDLGPPPTHLDDIKSNAKAQEEIDAIMPTESEMRILKEDGIVDTDGQLIQ